MYTHLHMHIGSVSDGIQHESTSSSSSGEVSSPHYTGPPNSVTYVNPLHRSSNSAAPPSADNHVTNGFHSQQQQPHQQNAHYYSPSHYPPSTGIPTAQQLVYMQQHPPPSYYQQHQIVGSRASADAAYQPPRSVSVCTLGRFRA